MFNENSGMVQVWVRLITEGTYTRAQIPNISNLRAVVISVLDKNGK